MIVVIGATGNVGSALVDQLCDSGERPRIVVRDDRKARRWEKCVETVVGDMREPETRDRALMGAERLFCLSFIEQPPEVDRAITDAAREAGVRHIVKLSTIGASSSAPIGLRHLEREDWIRASGVAWTFLRPTFFMANSLRWASMIKTEGRVVAPAADGKIPPISERDIAEVAKLCLLQPGHEGKTYELTGAELISAREQVEVLSRVLGKPITFVEVDIENAIGQMRALGRPPWVLESLQEMWIAVRAGRGGQRTSTFEELTGQAPQNFEAWCREHRSEFA